VRNVVLIIATVVAVVVDGFFALVNFYPVAPPRDRGPERVVLTSLNEKQAKWVQENMLDEYNAEHATNFKIRSVPDEGLLRALRQDDVALAVLPEIEADQAANENHVVPFDGVVSRARIAEDFANVRPEILESARYRDQQFFLPRAVALDVAVYRISKVRDALLHWQLVRPEIESALRAVNGRGLPAQYVLEQQPADWDAYDLFVLAYYWAHRGYSGQHAKPRVAHRVGLSTEAQLEIAAAMYRAGMSDRTLAAHDSKPALDWFQWETLYREQNLYAQEMFEPAGIDDQAILDGITRGDFYLTSVDQMQAFSLHGGSYRGALALVPDGDDLAFTAMPRFASLELDETGIPVRRADPFSFRETLVWALPAQSPVQQEAYNLIRWIVERENHARECEALGILPMRRDVIRERETLFREPWMQDALEAGLDQWSRAQVPPSTLQGALGVDYAVAWHRIVAQREVAPSARAGFGPLLTAQIDRAAAVHAAEQLVAAHHREPIAEEDAEAAFAMPALREPMVIEGLSRDAGVDSGITAEVVR
jgi:hypothetical protein